LKYNLLAPTLPTGRQVAAESLLGRKPIFSWFGRATNGSSCRTLEKKVFEQKLVVKSGISF